ncbi:hypothetical protein [Sphingobacterium lumbrici]|uniref:hypothetical protein n=1 Tax=Sphingobacterium lumbrici TaxID=2559600 RepID=UPI00112A312F|nr:hypothetical protein [Sphingobacterium lumbrici]
MNSFKHIKYIVFLVGTISCLGLGSCSKSDSPYYDYENTVQSYNGSALDYLKAQPAGTFDSLLLVLERYPDLADTLQNAQVTLFAPVNKNFEAAVKYLNITRSNQGKEPIYLNDANGFLLEQLICKYIIRGNRDTEAYINERDGILLTSIIYEYPMHVKYVKLSSSGFVSGGASSLNFSNPYGSVFTQDWVTTIANTVNIKTNNATINILTPIHNFGFDEFTLRLND